MRKRKFRVSFHCTEHDIERTKSYKISLNFVNTLVGGVGCSDM